MRKKELSARALETRLDEQETTLSAVIDQSRLEIQALKKALRNMKNTVVEEGTQVLSTVNTNILSKKESKKLKKMANIHNVTIGQKLLNMSTKVDELSLLAENSVKNAVESEMKKRDFEA